MSWKESAKKRAALEAAKHVEDGFAVGVGSGSTTAYAIEEIGRRIKEDGLRVQCVPASYQSFLLAVEFGMPVTTLNEHSNLDLYIDGADQIDRNLNLIKGGGGALTREKITACVAKRFIVIADETKLAKSLGENQSLPIEVLPFGEPVVKSRIRNIGGKPVLRMIKERFIPYITDNGNFILDVDFGVIDKPKELEAELKSIPGVIETGLFIEMADAAYIGSATTVKMLRREKINL